MKMRLASLCILLSFTTYAQQKLFPVEIKNKWGYMNAEGKMVLPATFDYADDFVDGFAVVAVKNLPCIINTKGERKIDTGLYQNIGHFSQGLAAVMDYNNQKFYIDSNGTKMITLPADIYEARAFSDDVAVVSKKLDKHETKFGRDIETLDYRFAYINKKGELITDFIFDDADDMQDGIARYRQDTKFGLVNKKGEQVIKPTYFNIGNFNEGLAVADVNAKFGYTNTKGELVIKANFDFCYDFTGGLAGVYTKGKYGFINTSGEIKIAPQFDQIKPFSEGKAAVMKDGKWGFINTSGELVLRHVFDNASVFSEGKCAVLIKHNWGFIDATGALIIPADFDAVGSFHDGIADVVFRDINLYVNSRGQLLPIIEKK